MMARFTLVWVLASIVQVFAQPSPDVQKRISAAIAAAANASTIDYTEFVNPFIGTDFNFYGDVCPGASVPFGMVKFTTDFTGYAPAGYIADPSQSVRGMSPLHDSGTGSSLGTYGNFEIMPLMCPDGFDTCTTRLDDRERLRKNNTDEASPGYFALTLDNEIKMEATSTRRAGLERFTFPHQTTPYFVLDLANDLPASFAGGSLDIDPEMGRITIGGHWGSSFGPGAFHYQAFACYDLLNGGNQTLKEYGVWTGDDYGLDAKGLGMTHLNLSVNLIGGTPYESGALFSFSNSPSTILIRVGVSFVSSAQACANAESEIGDATFEEVWDASRSAWNERLRKIEVDFELGGTPENVTEMLYSSLYRASLTPNNATGETQGAFANTTSMYFDSFYCSWDTFRTFYPLMALHSPDTFAEIVDSYIDGYRKLGWMPECRANNLPGWTQGGSSADPIVGHFAISYHNEAAALGIDLDELFAAQLQDGEVTPPEWNIEGRQIGVYKQYGYVPFAALDTSSTGRQTREGSRTLEYAFEDFSIRQVALLLNQTDIEAEYANRSLFYRNVWDPEVQSDGFEGFMQKRFMNGSFAHTNPVDCSPNDNDTSRECSLQEDNETGFYESSAWEYSWFAPHDTAYLMELMGGNATFVKRLNHFFDAGYYLAGNEPSFQTPIGYHYANQPSKSVDRVRQIVFENFGITTEGIPGNDDQAAMATLLIWHLLGLYPVPSTSEILVLSSFIPKYTIHNTYLNTSTTLTTLNYDPTSVLNASTNGTVPPGASAYVKSVTINGVTQPGRCAFDFYDTFRVGGEIVVELTGEKGEAEGCDATGGGGGTGTGNGTGGGVPQSLSGGGFASVR
ncbi:glycoside hydrolase family 92 protein [Stereum hirsutum FP-91666 SS1]|uniref:glycoside hydrolase family 92 protein n=1 Tax=Stereum hirsutum (strain FP-91666) TaxID=721885 RepID=UPI000444A323|nr:glycoside hydrolase family 92 protein [Stereum hirsutum FP-91666 SS1]EIM82754.1 glycoside hydrolase family 92 protein [Stereum hirsutum FP-91666 SS1]